MAAKFALIIGNSHYDDPNLSRLKAPDLDVPGLEEVLKAPEIGQFDEVTTLLNETGAAVRRAVARFYERRRRDDLLLLYFSGHGVKDEQGHLYLALRDTETALLAGSAMETHFISERMDRCYAKQQVLILDCCHSGAFGNGAKAAQGASVGTAEAFEGSGLGRVILTATDSTQYAWEGDRVIGDAETSLFTHFLVDGLRTGAADRDEDGVVTIDELYDYVRDRVVDVTPRQTPRKWSYRQEGDVVIAQNPFATRSRLPAEIDEAKNSKLSSLRLEAVRDLEKLLRGRNLGRSRAALSALRELERDDSRKVADAASQALKAYKREWPADDDTELIDPKSKPGSVIDVPIRSIPAPAEDRRSTAAPAEDRRSIAATAEDRRSIAATAEDRRSRGSTPAARLEQREITPSDIFISYEHGDRPKARILADALAQEGWTVWWDRRIAPGEAFDLVIERELASCKCVIVLWTGRSVGATWVRNEARRAAKRGVLVPVLMETVQPPLEFDNLQAADLTTWEANAKHPEFEAVLDRIQAIAPRTVRMARAAVDQAMREFYAGRAREALTILKEFPQPHPLVSQALADLTTEAQRLESARAEAVRQRGEALERQQRLFVAIDHVEELIGRAESDAAEQALAAAEKEFESSQELRPLRERLNTLRAAEVERRERERERVERERVERERVERERVERKRVERKRERVEATRRETEAARNPQPSIGEQTLLLRTDPPRPAEKRPLPRSPVDAVESRPQKQSVFHSRSVVIAIAAGLAILIVAAWMLGWRPTAPGTVNDASPQDQPPAPSAREPAAPAPPPASSRTAATNTKPSLLPSTEIRGFPPARAAVRENRPPRIQPVEAPETRPASRGGVDEFRTRARNQRQTGDRIQSLNTVVEGLKLFPKDATLTTILNSLFADAQAAVTRAKREAANVNAEERADDIFGAGLQKEREAAKLRRSGRTDEATRALWIAADQFRTAADYARQIADEEAAEQARIDARAKAGANTNTAAPGNNAAAAGDGKPPDRAAEEVLVARALRQYEAAYAKLNADAVKSVYPTAPVEELSQEFAGYRSYTLRVKIHVYDHYGAGDLKWINVPATVVHVISPKAGTTTTTFEKAQTFRMIKQNGAWIIGLIW